jgi:hypothetical protein
MERPLRSCVQRQQREREAADRGNDPSDVHADFPNP